LHYGVLKIFFILSILLFLPFYQGNASGYTNTPNPTVPSDIIAKCDGGNYSTAACDLAKEMSSLSPNNVATFGLSGKDSKVIEQTLRILDNMTLTKVLQSITTDELVQIRQKLTNQTFDNILPDSLRENLLYRLSASE